LGQAPPRQQQLGGATAPRTHTMEAMPASAAGSDCQSGGTLRSKERAEPQPGAEMPCSSA
jgi:hypothetical protein